MSKPVSDPGLAAAIAKFRTKREFAQALGVTPQLISAWKCVPHTRVLEVERLTGVSRHILRPDLHPPIPTTSVSLTASFVPFLGVFGGGAAV